MFQIPYSATEDDVSDFFGGNVGGVVEVVLPIDRDTGRVRGFGFIEFQTDTQAANAIRNLDGAQMGGRDLKVSMAHDRKGGSGGRQQQRR
jgi:RNA recognition motif-containing protein